MGRFANSWSLTKASLHIVSQDKELLVLPILSFLASVAAFLAVVGIGFGARIVPDVTLANGQPNIPGILLAAVTYLALAFVQVYFGAAVVAGASERLAGGDPTLGSCLRAANRRVGRLFVWSIFVAVVNILLQMLRERGGTLGRLAAGVGNLAWSLATYFMIPILLFEDQPVTKSIGRSGSLFKQTWGETVIGTGGVGLVFGIAMFVLGLIGFLVAQPLYASGGILALLPVLVLVVLGIVLLATLQSVLGGVYKAALYRYATTGQMVPGFEPNQIQGAFVPK
ncbi:MAG TPA: DUF6159 family protein [Candidatus Thermoplasmatota archaeon]|nr:DUF6159 family protein [Candidatus Thermoplasmatota archaeon]